MPASFHMNRRTLLVAATALTAIALPALALALVQAKTVRRISTPAVPDAWHAKMWTAFKDTLEKSAPGEFDVQINLNASLFKQGAEPTAMARGNLELTSMSPADIAKLVPEFSVFTAGYMLRDPSHQQKGTDRKFNRLGQFMARVLSEKTLLFSELGAGAVAH